MKKGTSIRIFTFFFLHGVLWAQPTRGLEEKDGIITRDPVKRIALVVGNSEYKHADVLKNPVNDAALMDSTLKRAGFEVIKIINAKKEELEESLIEFTNRVEEGGYGVALYYYSGHGMEVKGTNFIIPVDVKLDRVEQVPYLCMNAQMILDMMRSSKATTKIMILDACRDNPLPSNPNRSLGGKGLAGMQAPEGTFIGFATAMGEVALDGTGKNSPFTTALSESILVPGLDIAHVFYRVTASTQEFAKKVGANQTPYVNSSLNGSFIFTPRTIEPDDNRIITTTDRDQDGVFDELDDCPTEFGTVNGCPDSDGDGISDLKDKCPFDIGIMEQNGCPVFADDADGDGVKNEIDKCPLLKGKRDWQGCPDSDGDKVPDHLDRCPTQPGKTDRHGCPDIVSMSNYVEPFGGRFIFVKGGKFKMGCTRQDWDCGDNEMLAHFATVEDFYLGETEVTFGQFKAFIDESGYVTDAEKNGASNVYCDSKFIQKNDINWRFDAYGKKRERKDYDHPVVHVSWNDAVAYAEWLSRKSGVAYRLPTEAEWEFAARGGQAGSGLEFAGSNTVGEIGWNGSNSGFNSHSVKGKKPNELGLFDMSGNVWELCSDWYGHYSSDLVENPKGPSNGTARVRRGGSWSGTSNNCRVSFRSYYVQDGRCASLGFRLARSK